MTTMMRPPLADWQTELVSEFSSAEGVAGSVAYDLLQHARGLADDLAVLNREDATFEIVHELVTTAAHVGFQVGRLDLSALDEEATIADVARGVAALMRLDVRP